LKQPAVFSNCIPFAVQCKQSFTPVCVSCKGIWNCPEHKHAPRNEGVWKSGGVTQSIRDFRARSGRVVSFCPATLHIVPTEKQAAWSRRFTLTLWKRRK